MEEVYNKTLTKLFNGAKNACNNNLQDVGNAAVKLPERKDRCQEIRYGAYCQGCDRGGLNSQIHCRNCCLFHYRENSMEQHNENKSSSELQKQKMFFKPISSNNPDSNSSAIFNIDFSAAQNMNRTEPICVSCVRFSSTAGALNPSVIASRQPCSSCLGSTCQVCLNQCKGCSSAVCGNCSIDIESVNGYKAEMFIVCLGCRDRYDSTSCMDTG